MSDGAAAGAPLPAVEVMQQALNALDMMQMLFEQELREIDGERVQHVRDAIAALRAHMAQLPAQPSAIFPTAPPSRDQQIREGMAKASAPDADSTAAQHITAEALRLTQHAAVLGLVVTIERDHSRCLSMADGEYVIGIRPLRQTT